MYVHVSIYISLPNRLHSDGCFACPKTEETDGTWGFSDYPSLPCTLSPSSVRTWYGLWNSVRKWHCQMFFLCCSFSPSPNHLWQHCWKPVSTSDLWFWCWLGDATNCSVPGRLIHYPAASLSGSCKKGKSHDGDGDPWRFFRELHHFLAGVGCMVTPFNFFPFFCPQIQYCFLEKEKDTAVRNCYKLSSILSPFTSPGLGCSFNLWQQPED